MTTPIWLAIMSAILLLVVSRRTIRLDTGDLDYFSFAIGSPLLAIPALMRVVVSILVLLAGLYVILDHSYNVDDKKWGYGMVGTIVGYWLRSTGRAS